MSPTPTPAADLQICESYLSASAPRHSPRRRGYGLTPQQAHRDAGHAASCLPWARTRWTWVRDLAAPPSLTCRDELIAWAVIGVEGNVTTDTECPLWQECAAAIRAGRYATAVRAYLAWQARG